MPIQLDSNTSAGPIVAADTVSGGGDTFFPISKIAFGAVGAATRVDTSNPLPVNIFGSDSAHGAFVFNNAGTALFLAGDTAGTPVDDSNPLPVAIISGADANDTTVTVSGTVTVANDSSDRIGVQNIPAAPLFIAGDTAGTPVDDTNAFPVSVIGSATVDLGANNDVINTAATPFFVAGDTSGTPVDDTNAFPVAIISGADANDTTVTVSNDSSDPIGVVNAPGDPLHIASDTAATPVANASPLPVKIFPTSDTLGLDIFRDATNDTAAALVKGTPGQLYGWYLFNPDTASVAYVHLFNDTAVTQGTDSDVMVFALPPLGGANAQLSAGILFNTGISVMTTGGAGSTDTTAAPTATIVNLLYK